MLNLANLGREFTLALTALALTPPLTRTLLIYTATPPLVANQGFFAMIDPMSWASNDQIGLAKG